MSLTVLYPTLPNTVDQARLDRVLDRALAGREVRLIRRSEDLSQLQGERILFALSLDEAGQNFEYYRMLSQLSRNCWRAAPAVSLWTAPESSTPSPRRRSWPWP